MNLLFYFMIILSSTSTYNSLNTIVANDNEFYICDYASKRLGKTTIVIVETKDSIAIECSYTFYYTKEKITKIIKNINPFKYKYIKLNNGNIVFVDKKKEYYTDKNFLDKKYNSNDFYKLISSKFLYYKNKEKYFVIEKLYQNKR